MVRNHHLNAALTEPGAEEYREKTFVGGGKLSSRASHFVLLGLLSMIALGAMNFLAEREMSAAADEVAAAREMVARVEGIERGYWQVRGEERGFLLSGDLRHVERYEKAVAALRVELDALEERANAKTMLSQVTSIIEGLAQYEGEFRSVVEAQKTLAKTDATSVAFVLPESAVEGQTKLSPEVVARLKDLTASTEAMMEQEKRTVQMNERFAYMNPFLDGLVALSQDRLVGALGREVETRHLVRLALPASGAAILLVFMALGLVLMRSVSAPLRAIASAAAGLADGDDQVSIPAQGNRDEMGDLARALAAFRANLGEAQRLRDDLGAAKADVERGAAALLRARQAGTADRAGAAAAPPTAGASDRISLLSQQVAQSSQSVSAAARETERTGALIRGLAEAAAGVDEVENLLGTISNEVASDGDPPDRRFDGIRATTNQAALAAKDVADAIGQVRRMAAEIADASSGQALQTTSELLQQSEDLRGMLDDLVTKIRDTGGPSA